MTTRRWALRVALVVLAAVLVGWAGDVRFGSGSDAGGKLATASVMAERFTCDPDVGWWAAEHDPDAELHQLVHTDAHGDQFVQATSLSYQCVVMPLQRAFGPWGPILLSILGAVAAALAAARIVWRLEGGAAGQIAAFWLVGLAGPAFFYALDVWEHAPALGLLAWVVALALGPPTVGRAVAMGALGALAVTLRAEAALYLVALVGAALTVPAVRQRWLGRGAACVAGAVSAGVVTGAYLLLERALVQASVRGDRSADLAGRAGGELGERATTAVLTTVGLFASEEGAALLIGAVLVGLLLVHARRALAAPDQRPEPLQLGLGLGLLTRFAGGLGFVPGAMPAAPMAAAGLFTSGRSPEHRLLVRTAVAAPVLVLLLQWTGNLVAQWGGRYLLPSGLVLTAAGCSAMGAGRGRRGFVALLVASVAIGGLGVAWRIERSNGVAHAVDAIQHGPADEIVLTTIVNLGREAGGAYGERRWLVAGSVDELERAGEIIAAEQPSAVVVVVTEDGALDLGAAAAAYRLDRTERVDFLGVPLRVQRFERMFPQRGGAGG